MQSEQTQQDRTDPELLALLERVKSLPPPTPREKIEQRRSWVRGEMLLDGKLSEAEVDALLLNIPEFALLAELTASQAREAALREALEEIGQIAFEGRTEDGYSEADALRAIHDVVARAALQKE